MLCGGKLVTHCGNADTRQNDTRFRYHISVCPSVRLQFFMYPAMGVTLYRWGVMARRRRRRIAELRAQADARI